MSDAGFEGVFMRTGLYLGLACLLTITVEAPNFAGDLAADNSQAGVRLAMSTAVGAPDEAAPEHKSLVSWQPWTNDLFSRAKTEDRLVILDLEAVWCHWCHVMDQNTYSNEAVAKELKDHYIAVKVDQDSRPDLSNRYEQYGWPATIIFAPDGRELAKRSGFIRADEMLKLLKTLAKKRVAESPEKKPDIKFSTETALPAALRDALLKRHIEGYDHKEGGWSTNQKFLDPDTLEYALARAKDGDKSESEMALQTLIAQLNLLDPVWGGVYQYSTNGDWKHAHFEKIMQVQGENIRIYSMGYQYFKDPRFLEAAKSIAKYLHEFLRADNGAFYTSQDADLKPGEHSQDYFNLSDAARRKLGVPRVDKHIYSRENAWAINGLTSLYMASADEQYLKEAIQAANWIIANRSLPGGGFRHDESDSAGPYLGDTLYMGRAFLNLYQATGDRQWLRKAEDAAGFIAANFKSNSSAPGFITAVWPPDAAEAQRPKPLLDENTTLARFSNALFYASGKKEYKAMAENCMSFIATPEIANSRRILVSGMLLSDREISSSPAHITIVGAKSDPAALALFQAANMYPVAYKRVEWYDSKEGPMPNPDTEYPEMPKAAAFACANQRCSLPVFTPAGIAAAVENMLKAH